MTFIKIDIDYMGLNYWDGMRVKNIEYILSNPNRIYEISEIDSNGDIFLKDPILQDTCFSESEIIRQEKQVI